MYGSRATALRLLRRQLEVGRAASTARPALVTGATPSPGSLPAPPGGLDVLYYARDVLVVHKPVGLVAQGGSEDPQRQRGGNPTLDEHLDELAARLGLAQDPVPFRPSSQSGGAEVARSSQIQPAADEADPQRGRQLIRGLHRLDKDVEGPLMFATSQRKAKELARQFRSGAIGKTYYALVNRYLPLRERPSTPLGEELKHPVTTYTAVDSDGRVSPLSSPPKLRTSLFPRGLTGQARPEPIENRTSYAFLGGSKALNLSLIRLHPHTGRKHQLRLFCAHHLRAPIVGDDIYASDNLLPTNAALRPAFLRPSRRTPLFLKCTALEFADHTPSGRLQRVLVRQPDSPGADGAGWAGVRDALDEWVGDALEERRAAEPVCKLQKEDELLREQRAREAVLLRRKVRQEKRKAEALAAKQSTQLKQGENA